MIVLCWHDPRGADSAHRTEFIRNMKYTLKKQCSKQITYATKTSDVHTENMFRIFLTFVFLSNIIYLFE